MTLILTQRESRPQTWTGTLTRPEPTRTRYAVHGPPVELDCAVPSVGEAAEGWLGAFAVRDWPQGFVPVTGSVRPYEQAEVLRCISPTARRVSRAAGVAAADVPEVYEEGERFWVVDDRWGMAEINLLKGQWRSWVLPQPQIDPLQCAEAAVLWPVAQLLRARGVHLIPAASVVRDGWAALILCPFGLAPELTALVRSGYKLIGQRWTALREEDGRIALMHMPGYVERFSGPRLSQDRLTRNASSRRSRTVAADGWTDLCDEYLGGWQNHAFCDAVLIAEHGRRAQAHFRAAGPEEAPLALRRAWPITELHPQRRHGPMPARLAELCRCGTVQLSRNPSDLLTLLDSLRCAPPGAGSGGSGDGGTTLPAPAPADPDLALTPWATLPPTPAAA